MAQWTSIDSYRRRQRWRVRGPLQQRARAALADVRLVGLFGFFAALAYFQADLPVPWGPSAVDPASPYASNAANDWQAPGNLPRPAAPAPGRSEVDGGAAFAASRDMSQARFGMCHSGGGTNCVVDGDTFWYQGRKIRIADIDTPETHPPRCAEEARLGAAATERLQDLLNAGPFTLENIDRDTDSYGRALRVVTRGGESLGGVLVGEGLARWYAGGRQPWC